MGKPCLMYRCLLVRWWGKGNTGLATTLLDVHVFVFVLVGQGIHRLKPCLMYMFLFVCEWGRGYTGLATTLLGVQAYLLSLYTHLTLPTMAVV